MAPASRASTYEVSLLLFDLVGFTSLSADVGPSRIVELLDDMYASFDRIVAHRGVRKIETIGDAFLVACGAPEPVDLVVSSATIAKCAIDMLGAVQSFSHRFGPRLKGHKLQARIGIHCGRVLAGVIGAQLPRFQLFGAAVDDVQAMESSSEAGRVHASPEILRHLMSTVSPAVEDSRKHSHLRAEAQARQAASSRFGCCARALDAGSGGGGNAISPQRPPLSEAQLLPSSTTRRITSAEVAPEPAPAPEGAAGAHPAAPVRRAVPDIKIARSFPDGSAFIERDRATGLAMGIQW
jgi:class 3 adenylate cyclase